VLAGRAILGLSLTLTLTGCHKNVDPSQAARAQKRLQKAPELRIVEPIYSGGFENDWTEAAPALKRAPGPATVTLTDQPGWSISKATLRARAFGAIVFRVQSPTPRPDIEITLHASDQTTFPRVKVRQIHLTELGEGWTKVVVPFSELDPNLVRFDTITFHGPKAQPAPTLQIDGIGLTPAEGIAAALDPGSGGRVTHMEVDCRARPKPISPRLYGMGYYALTDKDDGQWAFGATGRRWGGNTMTRYNWQLGNAWSTGKDWYWENVEIPPYTAFLDADAEHGVESALTVPMIGWVAKDTTSSSFPVSEFGPQQATDEKGRPNAGNGVDKTGRPLPPGPPTRTSVAAPPEFIGRWVQAIRARDAERGKRSVDMYILDNEPALWHQTHRDVHPEPLTYDELLHRTLTYGAAVRAADPEARIAGPAAWGWPELFYSAKDSSVGLFLRPDRRAHGDVPLLPWYLQRLRDEEKKSGVHVLDFVDVHFYPQADGIYGENGKVDAKSAALRIRSTRALWDRSYSDESYIKEPIYLLPRLHEWIDAQYPGRGIVIGEWNMGAERHMSGGLATAEVLGRFGQNDVAAAYYWTVPPRDSPSFYAFRAFRNFDGKQGRFLDYSMPATASDSSSLFASRDAEGKHLVLVALNFAPDVALAVEMDLVGCSDIAHRSTYVYTNGSKDGFREQPAVEGEGAHLRQGLPGYSITVFDLALAHVIPTPVR
jgi:hypothetical protein